MRTGVAIASASDVAYDLAYHPAHRLERAWLAAVPHPSVLAMPASGSARSSHAPHPHAAGVRPADSRSPVLVVDDDRAIRDSLRMVLEDVGYAVIEACDGVEAMDALREATGPMVVLLDIMMPRMNGEDVLREVSHDARLRTNHAFVVITANRQALSPAFRDQLDTMRIPIIDKPPDIDDLIAQVARAEQRLPPTR